MLTEEDKNDIYDLVRLAMISESEIRKAVWKELVLFTFLMLTGGVIGVFLGFCIKSWLGLL